MRIIVGVLALALGVPGAEAVTDHLQCYKVTNANLKRLKAIIDLNAPLLGPAPGCKLTKAKLYCVPAEKQVQPGTLFDGRKPLDDRGFL